MEETSRPEDLGPMEEGSSYIYMKLNVGGASNRGGRCWNGDLSGDEIMMVDPTEPTWQAQWHAHIATLSFPTSLLYFHQ